MTMLVKNVPNMIPAAYNMCKIHGEAFDESWADSIPDDLSQICTVQSVVAQLHSGKL